MKTLSSALGAILAIAALGATVSSPANALSVKECSAKYAAAKADGSVNGKSWNDFRKLECAADTAPASAAKADDKAAQPATAAAAPSKKIETPAQAAAAPAAKTASKPAPSAATAPATANVTGAVFPKTISTAFAQESSGKARLHTCLEQYKSNKASNANGGLKWIQKGGGYYSECNKQLKS
jgi:hypothetical protein